MTVPRLLDVFARLVDDAPDAIALFDGHAGQQDPSPVTRAQLSDMASAMAADLLELGVGPDDCIGVWLPNWSQAVAAQLAALSVGAHVIGINTRYNTDELAHILRSATPRLVLLAHDFNELDLVGRLSTAVSTIDVPGPAVMVVTAPGKAASVDVSAYDMGAGASTFEPTRPGSGLAPHAHIGLATAFTTSGSTGRAKVAAHNEAGVVEHALAVGDRLGLTHRDVMLGALPLSGVFGFSASMAALLSGSAILLEPVFDAHGVLADMASCNVTHLVGADDLLGRIAGAWRADRPALGLRWIGLADFEGHSRELAEWAEHELGSTVAGVYGSSELFALTAFWPDTYPSEIRWGGGGQVVMPSIEVRVVDPASDSPLPGGAQGEMQFRGPNVVDAYLGTEDLARGSFTDDGWFRSGDLGQLVAPGTVQYVCRMGDVLRLRGFLVDPAEIEMRLTEHPAVEIAKVVGVEGHDGATRAVAFVVLSGDDKPSEADLLDWSAKTLAKFKVPSEVRFLDEMPTTSGTNGTKIKAAALRELAIHERTPK